MTRDEQIREASIDYQLSTNPRAIGGDAFADMAREMNVNPSFIAGVKWKDIDGYEGIYKISDKGRIWSVPRLNRGRLFGGYILKDNIDKRNRMTASLSKDGKVKTVVLARLVAVAFIRKPLTGEEINHKDENPLNNSVDNLEWCDHKGNCKYCKIRREIEQDSLIAKLKNQ